MYESVDSRLGRNSRERRPLSAQPLGRPFTLSRDEQAETRGRECWNSIEFRCSPRAARESPRLFTGKHASGKTGPERERKRDRERETGAGSVGWDERGKRTTRRGRWNGRWADCRRSNSVESCRLDARSIGFFFFYIDRSIGKRRSWFIVATKGIFFNSNRVLDRRKKSESFVLRNTLDPLRHASSRGCRISISGGDLPVSRLEIRFWFSI